MYQSNVVWPDEVSTGNIENISTDEHVTQGQALLVCETIEREGLGGERKIFPLDTYVTPI